MMDKEDVLDALKMATAIVGVLTYVAVGGFVAFILIVLAAQLGVVLGIMAGIAILFAYVVGMILAFRLADELVW